MNAYIFDLDGTLLDSMGIWEQIDREFLSDRGLDLPPDYMQTIHSMSFSQAAAYTIARFDLADQVPTLIEEWNARAVEAYTHRVRLKPHADAYITALKQHGARLGIATSLPAVLYQPALQQNGIFHAFDVICTTDEIQTDKSSPDIFLLTAQKLKASVRECTVFEDLLSGVQSAKQAGMTVYGMYDPSSQADWLRIQQVADGVLYDFHDAPLPQE